MGTYKARIEVLGHSKHPNAHLTGTLAKYSHIHFWSFQVLPCASHGKLVHWVPIRCALRYLDIRITHTHISWVPCLNTDTSVSGRLVHGYLSEAH